MNLIRNIKILPQPGIIKQYNKQAIPVSGGK